MTYDLKIERLIDGSPQEVYDAFTQGEAMDEWYIDNPGWKVNVRECDVRVGGKTIVAFGPDVDAPYVEEMTYSDVVPGSKLAYHERFYMPDGSHFDTQLVVTFEVQGGKTMLTIVQTGFESKDDRDAHQGGWPGFIDRLEKVVVARRPA